MRIPHKRKNKLLDLLKVNVTSQNFRQSNFKNSQPAIERLLSIDPSIISNTSDNKTEQENDQDAYIDINELDFKPSPNEGSSLIFGSFENLYEGRLQF